MTTDLTRPPPLSDGEIQALLLLLLTARSNKWVSEDDLDHLVQWATETRLRATILDLALQGRVLIDWTASGPAVTWNSDPTLTQQVVDLVHGDDPPLTMGTAH